MALLGVGLVLGGAAAVATSAARAQAGGAPVLVWPARLSRTAGAMPRLGDAGGKAARRINAALDAADKRLRAAIGDCAQQARENQALGSDWTRTVRVTMGGPGFLSLVATDDAFCGGAHPDFGEIAFTFDLATGKPVDWATLLPAPLVEGETTGEAMDGTITGLVRSRRLASLDRHVSEDCGMPEDAGFQLWLEAKQGGVSFAWPDAPHAREDCGGATLLGPTALRRYGASPLLIRALAQARGAARQGRR